MFFWHQDIGNLMFNCLQNDDVIEFALFCLFFFKFFTIVEIFIINYIYLANFRLKFYFVTKVLAISCFHCLQNDDVIKSALFCRFFKNVFNIVWLQHVAVIYYRS